MNSEGGIRFANMKFLNAAPRPLSKNAANRLEERKLNQT